MKPIHSAEPLQTLAPDPGFDATVLIAAAKEAVRKAVRNALLWHKARGNPVVVWRDGRVVILVPEQIEVQAEAFVFRAPESRPGSGAVAPGHFSPAARSHACNDYRQESG